MRNTLTALIVMACTVYGAVSVEKTKAAKPVQSELVVTDTAPAVVTPAVLRNPVCPLAFDCENCACTDAANCNQTTKPAERVTKMPVQTVSRGGCANGSCAVPQKSKAPAASGSCASGSCGMSGGRVFPNRPRLFRRWR